MFRPRIHSICNCRMHAFPVEMRYGGRQWRFGREVHVMYCPVCGAEKYFIYTAFGAIRRVRAA